MTSDGDDSYIQFKYIVTFQYVKIICGHQKAGTLTKDQ